MMLLTLCRRLAATAFVSALVALVSGAPAVHAANGSRDVAALMDLRPGEWRELPNTPMSAVFPREEKTVFGVLGPKAVIIAWGGAAYDSKRNAFVFNGGGHTDYGGNEVYAFFLDELRWRRLTEPSPVRALPNGVYVTTDNTPISAHLYDGLEYLPNIDRIFRNGGSEYGGGLSFDRSAWLFDMSERRWERKSSGGGGYVTSAYDPVRGTVYVIGNDYVDEYDPQRDAWTRRLQGLPSFRSDVGAIDPVNRKLVTNSYVAGILVYDIRPDGSLSGRAQVTPKGASEWDKGMMALEYDPVRKVLVGWAAGRATAYLDTNTMTWSRLANANSSADPAKAGYPASGAIYGRWRYVPKYDVFIGYNNPYGNVWVWKPAAVDAGDTKPPPPPPKPVVKPLLDGLQNGQTVVIPPGVYREAAVITASNVVIKASRVHIADTAIEDKAALVVKGNNVTIEGLECSGIRVGDGNGACVRLEGRDLTLRKVHFHDNESGMLSWNQDSGTVLIDESRFEHNGPQHGIYIGRGNTHLIVRNSRFLSAKEEGHEIKSRASKNTIEGSVVASLDGEDSRLIDLPDGGENVIRRNILEEGPASSNQDVIGIGLEGHRFLHARNSTVIEDNTFIVDAPGKSVLVNVRNVPPAEFVRNKVVGGSRVGQGNTWFANRAAAGLRAYPALPDAR